jgi:tetratricopeptide (TPR) repeat protein
MKRALLHLSLAFFVSSLFCAGAAAQQRKPGGAQTNATKKSAQGANRKAPQGETKKTAPGATKRSTPAKTTTAAAPASQSEFDEIAKLPAAERIERLRAFIRTSRNPEATARAAELLTVARAAHGDERLRASDRLAGVELFRTAVAEAPATMSDKLFLEVVSQMPANLYALGEREAGLELARAVEQRARGNAPRLLSVAAFYLSIERPEEAARLAEQAAALQPDLASAHLALGAAYRVGLRLEEAANSFKRALELDPKSAGARRSLADLLRATGRAEEALALYRQQLEADPADTSARTGVVLSLFDMGQRAEAERELEAALFEQAGNLPLLVGASYWYATQGEGARALELAERAVALEPRYRWVWARVAHARALLAVNRPLEAERSLRAARELGSFPTLDYELAAALAAAGLYDEAAEELSRSFTIRDGKLETRLAGRIATSAESFSELLAPERRAGLFQFKGADSAATGRMLKSLLAFHQALRPGSEAGGVADARQAASAAREFAAGEDPLRAYRSLYAASRLSQRGVAGRVAFEQTEAAIAGVEDALSAPLAPVALFADDLRELRARARNSGEQMIVPQLPRERLSKVLRGRIEEEAGWALFNDGQTAEAVVRLRRAVSVLPENTDWWRSAEWRLGAALEASGSHRDALAAYVRSYKLAPDPARRAVIESLYRRLNNTVTGLDVLLEEARTTTAALAPPNASLTPAAEATPSPSTPTARTSSEPEPQPTPATNPEAARPEASPTPAEATPTPAEASPTPEVSATPEAASPSPEPTPTASPSPEATPGASPSPEASPERTTEPTPQPTPTPETAASTSEPVVAPTPEPAREPTPEPARDPAPEPTPAATPASSEVAAESRGATASPPRSSPGRARQRRAPGGDGAENNGGGRGGCTLVLGEEPLTIKSNGGAATFAARLENYTGAAPPRINPSTSNWADIIVIAEPRTEADGNGARFTVTSISNKTGAFIVNVNSPCGRRQVTVNVQ